MAKKSKFLRNFIAFLLLCVAGYLIWAFVLNKPIKEYELSSEPVKISKPYRKTVEQSIELTGFVEAEAMIPVVPFVSGTVEQYLFKAGDYVEKDQVMAGIDPKPYQLQADQAEAAFLAAEATFTRIENLYNLKAATQQNYDEAKAQRDAYKAQFDLAMVQLGYATVTAPVSGTVLTADSSKGSIGTSTSPLYVIADLENLIVKLNVPEKYFDIILNGKEEIKASVSRNGISIDTELDTVEPYISPQSKTFKVILRLKGDLSSFRPGMFVSVNLVYKTYENALVLDNETRNTDGSLYVYDAPTETASYVSIPVIASDHECFVIPEDWKNIYFIVDGQNSVFDGQKVTVL